jgi:hypothetical protein
MYFRAIKSRYDENDSGPTFQDEEMLEGDMKEYRSLLRSSVAQFRRKKGKK